MPPTTTVRVTFPRTSTSTPIFAESLKLSIAASVGKFPKLEFTHGDLVSLEFIKEERRITDGNAGVRYLLGELGPPKTASELLQSELLEKEESELRPLVAGEKVEEAMQWVENVLIKNTEDVIGNIDKPTLTDIIIFSTLYNILTTTPPDGKKYPKLETWFKKVSKVHCVVKGISQAKALVTGIPNADKKGDEVVQPELDPSTRKIQSRALLNLDMTKEKLPIDGQRNILITSALPYVNNVPHLGNIIGSTLSADVFARYCRARGYNAVYFCGTDEYGTATETKALEEGVSCQALCDKYHKVHRDVYKWFELSFDLFGRTTTQQQTDIGQDIFLRLHKNNYTNEESMTQLYCEKHQSFLADRYVEGTCPNCKYEDARGDQCDQCGKLINAVELINPRCKLDGARPVIRESTHMFLDLEKLQPEVEKWVEASSHRGKWSSNGIQITKSWLNEGLKPKCITRDLKWGTPVPLETMKNKVFYVWFDAPIGYPSITANYTKQWERWWKNPSQVKLYQFMGKDNVPFHTVIFPASLIGTGEDWTLLHHVSTTEYLQYESGKFSKSRGIGVFGDQAKDTGIPVSVWRYYLISSRPETGDTVFTWNEFITKNNTELLNNLGNFVNRIIKFADAKYDGIVPNFELKADTEMDLIKDVDKLLGIYVESLEAVKIRAGLKAMMDLSMRGNQYLQENKIDNALFANNRTRCDTIVGVAINLVYLLSALIYPFMPSTTDSILRQLNAPLRIIPNQWHMDIEPGHRIGKAEYLFTKIDEKMEAVWKAKYGGSQTAESAQVDGQKKESKKESKKNAKKNAAPAAPISEGPKSDELVALEKKIEEQGSLVRKLKADKSAEAQAKVPVEVAKLLDLKKQATGMK